MTPQFTTPCYVRVDDKDKRKEVVLKAIEIGLLPINIAECIDSNYLFAFDGLISRLYGKGLRGEQGEKELELAGFIDCGTNTELFLALAGMRSDTYNGQLMVCDETYTDPKMDYSIIEKGAVLMFGDFDEYAKAFYRRATAQEIIEHFNKQTNGTN